MSRSHRNDPEFAEGLNRALRAGRHKPSPEPEVEEPEVDQRTAEREARGVPRGEPAGSADAGARGDDAGRPDMGSRLNAALRGR
jgi:hypothetical protein